MGKTFKDRDKWERKRRERDEDTGFKEVKRTSRKRFHEKQPDDDDADAYAEWDQIEWD